MYFIINPQPQNCFPDLWQNLFIFFISWFHKSTSQHNSKYLTIHDCLDPMNFSISLNLLFLLTHEGNPQKKKPVNGDRDQNWSHTKLHASRAWLFFISQGSVLSFIAPKPCPSFKAPGSDLSFMAPEPCPSFMAPGLGSSFMAPRA